MKTIAMKEGNVTKFIISDETEVFFEEEKISIGALNHETVWDMNISNCFVIENIIAPPEDWIGNKYCYDETTEEKWVLNPDYVPPMTDEEIAAIIKRDASEKEQVVSE
jgi:hypothetical protein